MTPIALQAAAPGLRHIHQPGFRLCAALSALMFINAARSFHDPRIPA